MLSLITTRPSLLGCPTAQVLAVPSSTVFVPSMPDPRSEDLLPSRPPAAFYATWAKELWRQQEARLQVDLSVQYNMHCGGSMGIEAFNFLQVGGASSPLLIQSVM